MNIQDKDGANALKSYQCTKNNGMLTLKLNIGDTVTASGCGGSCPTMVISSLISPAIGGTYDIRYLIFGNGSAIANY